MTLVLKLLSGADEPVAYDVIVDSLAEAGHTGDLNDLFFIANENSWIEEDEDGNYVLGSEGQEIMEDVQYP